MEQLKFWAADQAAQDFYSAHPLEMLDNNLPDGTREFTWGVLIRLMQGTIDNMPGFNVLSKAHKEYLVSMCFAAMILGYKAGKGIQDVQNQSICNDA